MGANAAYSADEPATAYTNADRTYQVEIFRVEGGAALGDTRFAARTLPTGMKADSACGLRIHGKTALSRNGIGAIRTQTVGLVGQRRRQRHIRPGDSLGSP